MERPRRPGRAIAAAFYAVAYAAALALGFATGDGSGLEFLYAMLLAAPWSFLLVPFVLVAGHVFGVDLPFWLRMAAMSGGVLVNVWLIGFRRPVRSAQTPFRTES